MIIFKDKLTGDELLADSYDLKETDDGFFYEVEGKWVELADADVDIGANPSAEEAEEGVDSSARKVVDLVESFRLMEQPSYNKKDFMGYVKPWIAKIKGKLEGDAQTEFMSKAEPGVKLLLSKIKDLQFFIGESGDPEGTLVYAYYKDGAVNPTFLFPKYAMDEMKC